MQVACLISEMVSEDANIIFGTSVDESIGDEISVTLVATSLPQSGKEEPPAKIEVAPLLLRNSISPCAFAKLY